MDIKFKSKIEKYIYYETENGILLNGNSLEILPLLADESIQLVFTSPPYYNIRNYGIKGIGDEETPEQYINNLINLFNMIKDKLKQDGSCYINIFDKYGGSSNGSYNAPIETRGKQIKKLIKKNEEYLAKPQKSILKNKKSMLNLPEKFSIAMCDNGWIKRNTIIWHKPNAIPESVKDRFTNDFEYIYFFVKNTKYFFNMLYEAAVADTYRRIFGGSNLNKADKLNYKFKTNNFEKYKNRKQKELKEKGKIYRQKRTVWRIATKANSYLHPAVFPETICEPIVLASSHENDLVLDPFMGSGTLAAVCEKLKRKWIGIELNPQYCEMTKDRISKLTQQLKMF